MKGALAALVALVLVSLPAIAGVLTAKAVSRHPGFAHRGVNNVALTVLLGMQRIPVVNAAFRRRPPEFSLGRHRPLFPTSWWELGHRHFG